MDQSADMEYLGENVELDAYPDNMPVGYVNGGTTAMNTMEWADETIIAGDGLSPSLAHHPQTPYGQPPLNNGWQGTMSGSNFQDSVDYPRSHHLEP